MTAAAHAVSPPYTSAAPRRLALVGHGDALRCLNGHRLHDPLVWEHGGLRCTHKGAGGREDCGMIVYLLGGGLRSPQGSPIFLVAEITAEELVAMREQRMSWQEAASYLGVYVGGEHGGGR